MRILLIHGWALSPAIWSKLIPEIQTAIPKATLQKLDFGFFGRTDNVVGHFDVVIAHSFGLLWFLGQPDITCDQIVSISGFTRFFRAKDDRGFPGVFQNIIRRMQSRLKREPQELLNEFYVECGINDLDDDSAGQIRIRNREFIPERLDWGLCGLNSFDHREQWNALNIEADRRLIIAATDDRIVAKKLTTGCFEPSPINWIHSSSHLLPVAEPNQCGRLILNFLAQ